MEEWSGEQHGTSLMVPVLVAAESSSAKLKLGALRCPLLSCSWAGHTALETELAGDVALVVHREPW